MAGNGTPPAVMLTAMVTIAAKAIEMFRLNLLLNSTRRSFRRFLIISPPKPDHPAAEFFLARIVRGEYNDFLFAHGIEKAV
jgi:hypothetical protein